MFTHNVLVRVHVDSEAILFTLPEYTDCIVDELVVILSAAQYEVEQLDALLTEVLTDQHAPTPPR